MEEALYTTPLVSIGIPTYKRPDGLLRILECVTQQTYTNLEIIVSDNGTEGSEGERVRRIVEDFIKKDKRVFFYCHSSNVGPVDNFNFVLERSTADYFMWAADDDELYSNHVELLMKYHLNGEYALVASSQDHKNITTGEFFSFLPIKESVFSNNVQDRLKNFLYLHHWNCAKACILYGIYSKKIIKPCFLVFPENIRAAMLDVGGDMLLLYKVLAAGPVRFVNTKTWCRGERFTFSPPQKSGFSPMNVLKGIFGKLLHKNSEKLCAENIEEAIEVYHEYVYEIFISAGFSPQQAGVCVKYSKEHITGLLCRYA